MKRIMKKSSALIVVVLFFIAGRGFAQDTTMLTGTVSLKQCIDIAIKNNLQVNENRFIAENDRVNLMTARGNYLPSISANINHSLSEGRVINSVDNTYSTQSSTYANYSLNLNQTLWNAGSIRNYSQASRLAYEAGKMDLQQQKDNITINVILQYLQVLSYEEQLTAAKQQVESYHQQVSKSEALNEQGALPNPATLTDLKGYMASTELSVINLQKAVESAKITLVQYLNLPYSPNFDLEKIDENITPALYDAGADAVYQSALQTLAYIKAGRLRTLSAEKSLKSAKGQLWPTLSFGANAGSSFNSLATDPSGKIPYPKQLNNNFGSSFGIGLSIPILNGFRLKGQVQQARITLDRAKFEEISNNTALQQNVQQAYLNMKSGFDAYQKYQEQAKQFGESSRIAEVRFNEGVTTSVEYTIAKTNYDAATINLIATKYDYILRTKILDYYQGKLTLQP